MCRAPVEAPTPILSIDPLLNLRELREIIKIGSSSIYRKIEAGTFPKPLRLGPGTVRWRTSTIVAWLEKLEAA